MVDSEVSAQSFAWDVFDEWLSRLQRHTIDIDWDVPLVVLASWFGDGITPERAVTYILDEPNYLLPPSPIQSVLDAVKAGDK